ncbi:MAG: DNA-directed RNA polymerase subunit alpha [Patescibacteria group bacterium]
MTQITLPEKISVHDQGDNHYTVVIEPCYPGFGVTLGNSLRRVLLSALPGAAVTSFKIEGAQHEFDSVDHVKEDLVEIMLNLKKLRLKLFADEPTILTIEAKGEKVVTAADIKKNSAVEIINTDLVIATLTDKQAKFNMEITVDKGLGYVTVEQRGDKSKLPIGTIAIDASFSPVLNVGYEMVNVRVGEMTNYEKVTLDIVTDGTVDGRQAVTRAAQILKDHFEFLIGEESKSEEAAVDSEAPAAPKKRATRAKKTK